MHDLIYSLTPFLGGFVLASEWTSWQGFATNETQRTAIGWQLALGEAKLLLDWVFRHAAFVSHCYLPMPAASFAAASPYRAGSKHWSSSILKPNLFGCSVSGISVSSIVRPPVTCKQHTHAQSKP